MTKMTSLVRGERLIYQQDEHKQVLAVETPAWFAWLVTASTFAFTSDNSTWAAKWFHSTIPPGTPSTIPPGTPSTIRR
jgi:hypothetical protein